MLPNEGEVRMLTDPLVLEMMLAGRAKSAALPLVRLHSEQLQCVLRLTRVSALPHKASFLSLLLSSSARRVGGGRGGVG